MKKLIALVACLAITASTSADVTTLFDGGNGLSTPPDAVYWDLETTTIGLIITGFDTNTDAALGEAFNVRVYTIEGGFAGNEFDENLWTQVATGVGTGNGTGNSVDNVVLSNSFTLDAGITYGMVMVYDGPGGVNYTNGATGTPFAGSDGATLFSGVSQSTAFSSTLFADRIWNGTIYYTAIPEPASAAILGLGGVVLLLRRRR